MLRWLDIPPSWLLLSLAGVWGLDRLIPGLATGLAWLSRIGDGLVLLGLLSMGLGALELVRNRTTFVPRQVPANFARKGIYRITRNPIYLGDALVLGGAALHWDFWPALVAVPLFAAFITRRFILDEEDGLRARFGDEAEAWFGRVRRWI